jgi:hypothetical protein
MSDLFGVAGTELLDRLDLPALYAARMASLRRCSPGSSGAGWLRGDPRHPGWLSR